MNNQKYICQIDSEDDEKIIDTAISAEEAAQDFFDLYIDGRESSGEIDGILINVRNEAGEKYEFEVKVHLEPVAIVEAVS